VSTYGDRRPTRRGSFGLLVRDLAPHHADADDLLILTAAHLVDRVRDGVSVLCAPPGPEPPSHSGQPCGTVRRRVPLEYLPSIRVDAAVIKPYPGVKCSNDLECGAPTGLRDLRVEDHTDMIDVHKHGAQTGMRCGQLLPIAADHFMADVNSRYEGGWWVEGSDGRAFAEKGDSGAIVVDDERKVIGMVVAIESDSEHASAYVQGAREIFSALQIALL